MKHKFNTIPSKGFLWAALRKYQNQRVTFALDPSSHHWDSLEKAGFDRSQPMTVEGIFECLLKHGHTSPSQIEFYFRKVKFEQGNKSASWLENFPPSFRKRIPCCFFMTEMRGIGWVEYVNSLIPKLPVVQRLTVEDDFE
jgi:hypothetical protein